MSAAFAVSEHRYDAMKIREQLQTLRLSDATPTLAEAKRAARCVLNKKNLRLHLTLAVLATLVLWVGGIYVVECMFYAVPWKTVMDRSPALYHTLEALLYLVDAAIVLFLGLPLSYGTFRVIFSAAGQTVLPLSALFDAFSGSKPYRRALSVTLPCFLLLAVAGGAVYGLLRLFLWIGTFSIPAMILLTFTAAVVFCVFSIWLGGIFVVLPLSCRYPEMPVRTLFVASRRLTHKKLLLLWVFKLSFLAHVFLAILTFGITLIFDGLPFYSLSHILWLGFLPKTSLPETLQDPA